jgi:hypothetical protein
MPPTTLSTLRRPFPWLHSPLSRRLLPKRTWAMNKMKDRKTPNRLCSRNQRKSLTSEKSTTRSALRSFNKKSLALRPQSSKWTTRSKATMIRLPLPVHYTHIWTTYLVVTLSNKMPKSNFYRSASPIRRRESSNSRTIHR